MRHEQLFNNTWRCW